MRSVGRIVMRTRAYNGQSVIEGVLSDLALVF